MSYLRSHIVELLPFVILRSMHSLTSSGSADNTQGIYFNLGERNNLNQNQKGGLYRTICICIYARYLLVFPKQKNTRIHYIIQFFKIPGTNSWPLQSHIVSLVPVSFYILKSQTILEKEHVSKWTWKDMSRLDRGWGIKLWAVY